MTTRIAVEHELAAPPSQVFAVLADREFTQRRMALVPEMAAQVAAFTAGPEAVEFTVDAQLPASWMPAGVGGAPGITRHERWSLNGSGYAGEIRVTVSDLPVACGGELGVHAWQQGSVVSMVVDIQVDLPLFGPIVERMIRDRLEPAFTAELDLLADAVEGVTQSP